jgi:hypothetical protein
MDAGSGGGKLTSASPLEASAPFRQAGPQGAASVVRNRVKTQPRGCAGGRSKTAQWTVAMRANSGDSRAARGELVK